LVNLGGHASALGVSGDKKSQPTKESGFVPFFPLLRFILVTAAGTTAGATMTATFAAALLVAFGAATAIVSPISVALNRLQEVRRPDHCWKW